MTKLKNKDAKRKKKDLFKIHVCVCHFYSLLFATKFFIGVLMTIKIKKIEILCQKKIKITQKNP